MLRKYLDNSNPRDVNYVAFCADIDKTSDYQKQYVAKNPTGPETQLHGQLRHAGSNYFAGSTSGMDVVNNRFMEKRVEKSNNPDDVEDRIRATVVMKRIRLEEFFLDFDKLRKGKILRGHFKQVLSMINFNLTEEEYDVLCARYRTADPEFKIDYKAFAASINSAFTVYGIQKDPLAKVAPVTNDATVQARRKYLDFTDEEKALLEGILNQYRSAVQIKRIHLKPILADFDITKNQHVTKHQFLRTLDVLGVTAPSTTLNVLLKAYMDKGNADEVNYYDFCEDIDGSEQLFYVPRAFNHSFDYYPKTRPAKTGFDVSKATPDDIDDVLARLRRDCME